MKNGLGKPVDGVIQIASGGNKDEMAKYYIKTNENLQVTDVISTHTSTGHHIEDKPKNPIKYSLTQGGEEKEGCFNCSSLVTHVSSIKYGIALLGSENITTDGGTIYGEKDEKYKIPQLNLWAVTPNKLFQDARNAVNNKLIKGLVLKGGDDPQLKKPFLDAVTMGQLKDKNPKQ